MIEHTPTPWAADPDDRDGYEWNIHIVTESNRDMRVAFMTSGPEAAANADFIVKAVNCHDELVAALEAFRLRPDAIVASQGDTILRIPIAAIQQAAAAIAKAGAP